MKYNLVVDIGGTSTRVGLVENLKIIDIKKFTTYKDPIENCNMILSTFKDKDISQISIGLPGPFNKEKTCIIDSPNLKLWNNFMILDFFKSKEIECYIENDASIAALGSYSTLKSKPSKLLYITISTGFGSGLITDGQIYHDSKSRGYEMYNIPVNDYPNLGITNQTLESLCSGTGIYNHSKKFNNNVKSTKDVFKLSIDSILNITAIETRKAIISSSLQLKVNYIIFGGSVSFNNKSYIDKIMSMIDIDYSIVDDSVPLLGALEILKKKEKYEQL